MLNIISNNLKKANYGDYISLQENVGSFVGITIESYHLGVSNGWLIFTNSSDKKGFMKLIKNPEITSEFKELPMPEVEMILEGLILMEI